MRRTLALPPLALVALFVTACEVTTTRTVVVAPPPRRAARRAHATLTVIPPVTVENRAVLVKARSAMTPSASSSFSGWPVTNATDGDIHTSWYSGRDDSAAKGKSPYFQIEFSSPETVRHVTILGNRDPAYLTGYTILAGRLELFDRHQNVLLQVESDGTGNLRDFDFVLAKPVHGVKVVRFTSIEDEGDQNTYGDVAIAEFQVE